MRGFVNPDFIELPDAELGEKGYWGIYAHAPAKIVFNDVYIGEKALMQFSLGILSNAWENEGDGVRFEVDAVDKEGSTKKLFSKYIDPKKNPEDRRWHDESVSLTIVKNSTVTIVLSTHPGADEESINNNGDWAFWGRPILKSKGRASKQEKKSNDPNVILITIDTCRADYFHCYGNEWIDTPVIDTLANEGVLFENHYSASSTTSPSHVSILTSMQPYQHGVLTNGYKLATSVPRLPQFFFERGYKTGAVVSVHHLTDKFSGLGKWFDRFDALDAKWSEKTKGISTLTRGRRASTSAAIDWIEDVRNDSFFLWLHYYDPHAPYFAEGDFRKEYYDKDPKNPNNHSMDDAVFQSDEFMKWTLPYHDLDYFKKEYGAEITTVDSQIGRLLSSLERLKIKDNTIIVITADHGENLGDHNIYFDHWALFNTDIHVPLIMWYPKRIPKGKRIANQVTHIDIAPTLLDLIDELDNPLAKGLFDGKSLKPLWEGKKAYENRIIASNGLLYTEIAAWNDKYKVIWEIRDAKLTDKVKLRMDRVTVYDREKDPNELSPIACFYWGDQSERQEFRQEIAKEMNAIKDENESIKADKQLYKKLDMVKKWILNKQVPERSQLEALLKNGAEGIKASQRLSKRSKFRAYNNLNPEKIERRNVSTTDRRTFKRSDGR